MNIPVMLFYFSTLLIYFFLNQKMVSGTVLKVAPTWKKVGVLSQGNFDTIHHIAHNAEPVIANGNEHLYEMVRNGIVDAGLISGKILDAEGIFETFPSGSISPRAIMTRKNDSKTRRLMDAAIVRLQRSGLLSEFAQEHAPFEYVEVHMCRSDEPEKHLPFDETINTANKSVVHIGALGPYNWHQDGDYTQNPPVGFWPSFYDALDEILVNHTLMRQWYPTSKAVMDALLAGEIDATEGYWTVDSFYDAKPRTWFFDPGCTTLGYESSFFTLKAPDDPSKETSILTIWLSVSCGLVAVGAVFVIYMIHSERKGKPLFGPLLGSDSMNGQVESV